MSKKFNLADYLKDTTPVSNSDTEQIVRINLDLIDPDPSNFYSLEGIDELAGNIETVGLLDALRVRPNGERYTVVSGHRRRAACLLIRDGGSEMFAAGVPCIIEYGEASDAMRELRLIYANSATRVMSAADLSKQAERVTELLYQLKEQGVEFPGRMRDHVAQACKVSASKIARLHAIRENLRDSYRLMFDAGRMSEGNAYRISQETPDVQKQIFERLGTAACSLPAERLETCIDQIKRPAPDPEPARDPGYEHTDAVVSEYLQRRAEEDDRFFEKLSRVADTFLKDLDALESRQDGIERLKRYYRHAGHAGGEVDWQGSGKGLTLDDLSPDAILRTWTEVFDMLAGIALNREAIRLAGLPDRTGAVSKMDTEVEWKQGMPPRNGRYLCMVDIGTTRLHEQKCDYRDGAWSCYGRPFDEIGTVEFWWPLPPEKLVPTDSGEENEDGNEDCV